MLLYSDATYMCRIVNFIKLSFYSNAFIVRDYLHPLMTIADVESVSSWGKVELGDN